MLQAKTPRTPRVIASLRIPRSGMNMVHWYSKMQPIAPMKEEESEFSFNTVGIQVLLPGFLWINSVIACYCLVAV